VKLAAHPEKMRHLPWIGNVNRKKNLSTMY